MEGMHKSTSMMDLLNRMEVPTDGPETYCRLCLSKYGLTNLFSTERTEQTDSISSYSVELVKRIYECTNIKLSCTVDAGCAICGWCVQAVHDFYQFRERSNKVNDLIQKKKVVDVKRNKMHVANNQHHCPNCFAKFHHAASLTRHQKLDGCIASPKTSNHTLSKKQTGKPKEEVSSKTPVRRQIEPPAKKLTGQKQTRIKSGGDASQNVGEKKFPRPAYSFPCLIALALKNSRSGSMRLCEIYSFMCEHFPYFKTAPTRWKNSLRHNLSLNKCFVKIKKPATNGGQRKYCLWTMNPDKITKMDKALQKCSRKNPYAIHRAMVHPEFLEALERGEIKYDSTGDKDLDMEEGLESDGEEEENEEDEQDENDAALLEPPSEKTDVGTESYIISSLESRIDGEAEMPKFPARHISLPSHLANQVVELDDEDDDVELIAPKREPIYLDAESSVIKMPELLIIDEEDGDDQENLNLVIPDFYQQLKVIVEDRTNVLNVVEHDLMLLEENEYPVTV